MSTDPRIDAAIDVLRNTGYGPEADAVERLAGAERQIAAIRVDTLNAAADAWERLVVEGKPPIRGYQFLRARAAALGVTPTEPEGCKHPNGFDHLGCLNCSARAGSVAPTEPVNFKFKPDLAMAGSSPAPTEPPAPTQQERIEETMSRVRESFRAIKSAVDAGGIGLNLDERASGGRSDSTADAGSSDGTPGRLNLILVRSGRFL